MKSSKPTLKTRINRFIAESGVTSRRKADRLIETGKVMVNGKKISEFGMLVGPGDVVTVDGKKIRPEVEKVTVMFNKPPQVVTTMKDPEGRPCVGEFFAKAKIRLFPIGRLDWASEGLLLLTNDGDFSQRISHPTNKIPKTYLAKVDGDPTNESLQKLVKGFSIIGGRAQALFARVMETRGSNKYAWVQVILDEGRNHQVRLMLSKIGYDVKKLQRTAIGALKLSNLEKGKFRILEEEDIKKVFMMPKELRDQTGGKGVFLARRKRTPSTRTAKSFERESQRKKPRVPGEA
jgi:23S rRNA pseudouridine2605 synthase